MKVAVHSAVWLVAWCGGFAPAADAGFIGPYVLSNWTLINTNGNGAATTLDGGNSLILSGSNNGGGLPGSTEWIITVPVDDALSFGWSYFSLDAPEKDLAGYSIGSQFFLLSGSSGSSGNTGLLLKAGQSFGFNVRTSDNLGEPGILTITQFSSPATVPEPDGISFVVLGTALLALISHGQLRPVRECTRPSAPRVAELQNHIFVSGERGRRTEELRR